MDGSNAKRNQDQNQDSASYSTDAAIGPITKAQDLNDTLTYICKFFEKLLIPNEWEIAFTQYTSEESGYIWITRNPDHLKILSQGIDIFTEKLVQRLKTDYPRRFILNQCPRCSKATRTPVSKQCRYCGHDGHAA